MENRLVKKELFELIDVEIATIHLQDMKISEQAYKIYQLIGQYRDPKKLQVVNRPTHHFDLKCFK